MKVLQRLALVLAMGLLSACVAAVVAGATAGAVIYDGRGFVVLERDTRIFHVVHKTIMTDPRFRSSHISVTSFNEAVLLTGQTPVASLRVLAEKIAKATPHVLRVYNEISIGQPTELAVRAQDTWITTEIRSRLLTCKGLESGSIRVVTENGVVFLMGIVTHEQANLAVNVVRHVNGVRQVVKVFKYR